MLHKRMVVLFIQPVLLVCAPGLAGAWPKILPHHFGRYPTPPSVYGYKFDEPSPGYYGGGRYKEYYNFGWGFGYAGFPSPLPEFGHGPWLKHRYWPYPSCRLPTIADEAFYTSPAQIIVHVPADAEVWLEGQPTKQSGEVRTFVSPPLPHHKEFVYVVRVRWRTSGGVSEQFRSVSVHAGNQVTVRFPAAAEPEIIPATPRLHPVPE